MPTAYIRMYDPQLLQSESSTDSGYPDNGPPPYHAETVVIGGTNALRDNNLSTYVRLDASGNGDASVRDGVSMKCVLDAPDPVEDIIPVEWDNWGVSISLGMNAPGGGYAGLFFYIHEAEVPWPMNVEEPLWGWVQIGAVETGTVFTASLENVAGMIFAPEYHGPTTSDPAAGGKALLADLLDPDYRFAISLNMGSGSPFHFYSMIHEIYLYFEYTLPEDPDMPEYIEPLYQVQRARFVRLT